MQAGKWLDFSGKGLPNTFLQKKLEFAVNNTESVKYISPGLPFRLSGMATLGQSRTNIIPTLKTKNRTFFESPALLFEKWK